MSLPAHDHRPTIIEIVEPDADDCSSGPLPPEGNVKLRNYRLLSENIRAYTPTGDIHTSPTKGKLVAKFDVCASLATPRARILELLRPEDPGRDALEAIVRPAPRRGLARPLDEDTKRFLQRALLSPSPQGLSSANTPEPNHHQHKTEHNFLRPESNCSSEHNYLRPESNYTSDHNFPHNRNETAPEKSEHEVKVSQPKTGRSLADELREAEEEERSGGNYRKELMLEFRRCGGGMREAFERERLGKLALSVEEDEGQCDGGLTAAARRLDALLAESRELHAELAGIHEDMQVQCARAHRCGAAARALGAESRALRYLDDVVALLKGDVKAAVRARAWPFAIGPREPGRNYVI